MYIKVSLGLNHLFYELKTYIGRIPAVGQK